MPNRLCALVCSSMLIAVPAWAAQQRTTPVLSPGTPVIQEGGKSIDAPQSSTSIGGNSDGFQAQPTKPPGPQGLPPPKPGGLKQVGGQQGNAGQASTTATTSTRAVKSQSNIEATHKQTSDGIANNIRSRVAPKPPDGGPQGNAGQASTTATANTRGVKVKSNLTSANDSTRDAIANNIRGRVAPKPPDGGLLGGTSGMNQAAPSATGMAAPSPPPPPKFQ